MAKDKRQEEFSFVRQVKADENKLQPVRIPAWDCAVGRHQVQTNGVCMLCRKQILFGNESSDE